MSVRENLIKAKALVEKGLSVDMAIDQVTAPRSVARKEAYQAVRDAMPKDWMASDWGRPDRVMFRLNRAIGASE